MEARLSRVEEWTEGHEARCEERLGGIGREIRDLKDGVKAGQKQIWVLIIALCGWALSQVYDNLAHHPSTTTTTTVQVPLTAPRP